MVEGLAAPGGLDEEDRRIGGPLHRQTEGVFRSDLAAIGRRVAARTVTSRQLTETLAVLGADAGEVADPDAFGGAWFSVRADKPGVERLGRRIFGDVGDGLDLGVALHVRLADQDVDLQGLGEQVCRAQGGQQDERGFHK